MKIDADKVKSFENASQFGKWLATNHAKEQEVWIKVYKKDSGVASIDWNGCVIEALIWEQNIGNSFPRR